MFDGSCPMIWTWARTRGSIRYFLPVLCATVAMIRSMGIPSSADSLALADVLSAAELTPPNTVAASPAAAHAAMIDFIVHSIVTFLDREASRDTYVLPSSVPRRPALRRRTPHKHCFL